MKRNSREEGSKAQYNTGNSSGQVCNRSIPIENSSGGRDVQERDKIKKRKMENQRKRRANMTEDENNQIKTYNNKRKRLAYDNLNPEERLNYIAEKTQYNSKRVNIRLHNCARNNNVTVTHNDSSIGDLNSKCQHCEALFYPKENKNCCNKGKIKLELLKPLQPLIQRLLKNNDFQKNVRGYNSAFSFTSLGVKLDERFNNNYNYSFSINGGLNHLIGQLFPENRCNPQYFQMYFYSNEDQVNYRANLFENLNREIIDQLTDLINHINPYVFQFKQAFQQIQLSYNSQIKIRLIANPGTSKNYSLPTTNEVAVLFNENQAEKRDVIIKTRDGRLQRISQNHRLYMPLAYPLLFPEGEFGWCSELITDVTPMRSTPMEYYNYRLQIRENQNNLNRMGRLFQQYVVDAYTVMEQARLMFLREHQNTLRTELYNGLMDALSNDIEPQNIGSRVILPSSFTNGPRYMVQKYQDSMAIVCKNGKPDLFVTMTCNAQWPEIQNNLLRGQTAYDRPDLCARVFHEKFKILKDQLLKKSVLGKVIAFVYVIEFQKRGLPHAHMLLILSNEDKPRTTEDYDKIVSAELPDHLTHSEAFETVKKCMIHGPCGALCQVEKNGVMVCSKGYPKDFSDYTVIDGSSYPLYRRRNNGVFTYGCDNIADNRYVVPHNLYLCSLLDCHINVEICSSITSVKYLYKYVYKGHDKALIEISDTNDEITVHQETRYVSAIEGFWRINQLELNNNSPTVYQLAIHLENEQYIVFDHNNIERTAVNRDTTLTAWMKYNQEHDDGQRILYSDFPQRFVYNKTTRKWKKRGKGDAIGRIYNINPKFTEKYCLRLLLQHISGAKSFEDLRTVNGNIYPTYQSAAQAMGLFQDDLEWEKCLEAAVNYQHPKRLRELFCVILVFCNPANPLNLWNKFETSLIEDLLYMYENRHHSLQKSLREIDEYLSYHSMSLQNFNSLPQIDPFFEIQNTQLGEEEYSLSQQVDMSNYFDENIDSLNTEQRHIFTEIKNVLDSDENENNKIFFVDGPGGSGKTYLYKFLLYYVRKRNLIACAVASSGIASLLLPGGRTAHSRFGIPLVINEHSVSSIKCHSEKAALIRKAKLIIWDEAPMMRKEVFECVDRLLRDIMKVENPLNKNKLFGNKVIVFGGDFRQILPVIKKRLSIRYSIQRY